jgi:hypothetical protein
MKYLAILLLCLTMACHKTAPAAPVPGAINTFDSTMYRALMDSQAAINSLKADISSGKLPETPAIKSAMNQVIQDYNSADALWQVYHSSAGAAQPAPLQAAVTRLQTDVEFLAAGAK